MSSLPEMPDKDGNFGEYGGQIIPPPFDRGYGSNS